MSEARGEARLITIGVAENAGMFRLIEATTPGSSKYLTSRTNSSSQPTVMVCTSHTPACSLVTSTSEEEVVSSGT